MNLIPILKTFPIDTPLYSIVHGDCVFKGIDANSMIRISYPSKTELLYYCSSITKEGKLYDASIDLSKSECILFPSKTQRDWTKAKVPIKEGTPVMVSRDGLVWVLSKYTSKNTDKNYIVPVSVFNFEFPYSKPLLNYGLLNP